MKPAVFHEDAQRELLAAVAWHESKRPGLGRGLRVEIESAVHRICRGLHSYGGIDEAGVRSCRIHRFPFAILYLNFLAISGSLRLPVRAANLATGGTDNREDRVVGNNGSHPRGGLLELPAI